ncbi:MAG: carboxypeptidase regulatory-like domain-containing protein [Thermoplasmata archaeon]|nr:MAG: carboxypeptidase regulatory-like domain-containing protein [Thermoplasmata archaeon]
MKVSGHIGSRKFLSVLLVFCIVALLLFSTIPAQKPGSSISGCTEGIIVGFVKDAITDAPIQNALLTLEYHGEVYTELSDSKGKYMFTNVPICFCLKNISAAKEGYEIQYKMVAVHKITYVDFNLKPIDNNGGPNDCTITGVVTDAETDDPIPDTLMILKYHDVIRTELTDEKGQYTFINVPYCFCLKNVSASKKGYESQNQLVAVSEITYVNFSLTPSQDDQKGADSDIASGKNDKGQISSNLEACIIVTSIYACFLVILVALGIYLSSKKSRNLGHERMRK